MKENVYNLTVERYGQFDLILFLGVLYHLRDPMRALDAIWEVARGRLIVETQVIDDALLTPDGEFRRLADLHPDLERTPLMQFYPGASLNADETSVWAPNEECLRGMLVEAGFSVTGYTQSASGGLRSPTGRMTRTVAGGASSTARSECGAADEEVLRTLADGETGDPPASASAPELPSPPLEMRSPREGTAAKTVRGFIGWSR